MSLKSRVRRWLAGEHAVVLAFHGVVAEPLPFEMWQHTPATQIDAQLRHLARSYRCIPLAQLVAEHAEGRCERGTVALTFDDGFANNLHVLLPMLERYGLPATFFICTDPVLQGGQLWPERAACILAASPREAFDFAGRALRLESYASRSAAYRDVVASFRPLAPADYPAHLAALAVAAEVDPANLHGTPLYEAIRMLDASELQRLAASPLATIGAHTRGHWRLARLPDDAAEREIAGSREALLGVGIPTAFFAYPHGTADDYRPVHRDAALRAGFQASFNALGETLRPDSDAREFPRVCIGAPDSLAALDYVVGGGLALQERRSRPWFR